VGWEASGCVAEGGRTGGIRSAFPGSVCSLSLDLEPAQGIQPFHEGSLLRLARLGERESGFGFGGGDVWAGGAATGVVVTKGGAAVTEGHYLRERKAVPLEAGDPSPA